MITPMLACEDERRREAVHESLLNGFDFVEVSEDHLTLTVYFLGKAPKNFTQTNLVLEGGRRIQELAITQFMIERDKNPRHDDRLILKVNKGGDFSTYRLCAVELSEQGQAMVDGKVDGRRYYRPFPGFDPRYACIEFSFMAGCPSRLDCKTDQSCVPEPRPEPEINYLAKDYASFRQAMLDRLALLLPEWRERHVPDLGITLVELLAYVGDYLSYYQDAVGTEAYLDTARQRISVRRHARLVDYRLHEGCNARAWLCLWTDEDRPLDPANMSFLTKAKALEARGRTILNKEDLVGIQTGAYEEFEPRTIPRDSFDHHKLKEEIEHLAKLWIETAKADSYVELPKALSVRVKRLLVQLRGQPALLEAVLKEVWQDLDLLTDGLMHLYQAHNTINIYTWGDRQCCLPKGAMSATLRDRWKGEALDSDVPPVVTHRQPDGAGDHAGRMRPTQLRLRAGDVVIFEEVKGAKTGNPADADPSRRHAVRLTRVEPGFDPLYDVPVVEIEWGDEDALPFALCISAQLPAPDCRVVKDISVVCGNVILVDHGRSVSDHCTQVPVKETEQVCLCNGSAVETTLVPESITVTLQQGPLTYAAPFAPAASATTLLMQDPHEALPLVTLDSAQAGLGFCESTEGKRDPNWRWEPQPDLLRSGPDDRHCVVEIDNDRRAHVRFGDGELGKQPEAEVVLKPTYRIGGGAAGNVGAESIAYLLIRHERWSGNELSVRNPMPAVGGTEPEPLVEAKLFAPHAFRHRLERAVIAEDYATLAGRHRKLQRAAAALRWTGSWYEAAVGVDPIGTEEASAALLGEIEGSLFPYRRIGHDLAVYRVEYVPLDLALHVCVLPHYQQGHVEAALLNRFSNRVSIDGRPGFFHPDSLSFGESVYLSRIVAAAQAVVGVQSVTVTTLQRYKEQPQREIEEGVLKIGPMQIAQLDNDPNFPEQGVLTVTFGGGR